MPKEPTEPTTTYDPKVAPPVPEAQLTVSVGSETFVIANGETTSAAVELHNPSELGLLVPTLTSGTVTVQVSQDGTNFFGLVNAAGTAILVTGATTGAFAFSSADLAACRGYRYLRVVSGAAQGAARTFTLTRKIERTDPLV